MKKLLCLLMALLLGTMTFAAAQSVEPTYDATKALITELEANEIDYVCHGYNESYIERLTVTFKGENVDKITIDLFFQGHADLECMMRAWSVVTYDDGDMLTVYETLNTLNNRSRFARFYADKSDNTVTCAVDANLPTIEVAEDGSPDAEIGAVLYGMLKTMAEHIDAYYPELQAIAK
ncbi:MAG: YbjN domain-containing protein [Clostridia bacterium]|nr:YbjN domain-containing protein [Clostridia bacterium]